jgi:hypothetical protein
MSILKDLEQIGKAARGIDDEPPTNPRLFSVYMTVKTIQEGIKVKQQKKKREKKKKTTK